MNEIDIVEIISKPSKKERVGLSLEDIEIESKIVEIDLRREELEGHKQDRRERKKFADQIYWMLVAFLVAVMVIVSLCAVECLKFNLSDSVIITLLSTMSANMIGIFMVVARYLFKPANKT